MEIFSEEFKREVSSQLEAITNIVKKDNSNQMSDCEIAKAMEDSFFYNPDCDKEDNNKNNEGLHEEFKLIFKKEKKKKNKKFKEGDVVYWGEREGVVTDKYKEKDEASLHVCFKENVEFKSWELAFTKDGRFLLGTPIILSHFPYELKMKKLKQ